MRQKGFAPIIILVLVVLAVVGYFGYKNFLPKQQTLVTNFPTPITTLIPLQIGKIYTNTKYGYEFKYPSSLDIEVNEGMVGIEGDKYLQTIWLINPANSKLGAIPNIIVNFVPMIYYLPVNSAKDIFLNYKKEMDTENINNLDVISEGIVNIGNYSGYQVIRTMRAPKPSKEPYSVRKIIYLFEKNLPMSIEFGEWITEEQYQQKNYWPVYGRINDQVISTFKFTK